MYNWQATLKNKYTAAKIIKIIFKSVFSQALILTNDYFTYSRN